MPSSSMQIENFGSKEDDMSINFKSEICSPLIRIDTTLTDQFPVDEEKDASESNIGGNMLYLDYAMDDSDTQL